MENKLLGICIAYLVCVFFTCFMIKVMLFSEVNCKYGGTTKCLNINHSQEAVRD